MFTWISNAVISSCHCRYFTTWIMLFLKHSQYCWHHLNLNLSKFLLSFWSYNKYRYFFAVTKLLHQFPPLLAPPLSFCRQAPDGFILISFHFINVNCSISLNPFVWEPFECFDTFVICVHSWSDPLSDDSVSEQWWGGCSRVGDCGTFLEDMCVPPSTPVTCLI